MILVICYWRSVFSKSLIGAMSPNGNKYFFFQVFRLLSVPSELKIMPHTCASYSSFISFLSYLRLSYPACYWTLGPVSSLFTSSSSISFFFGAGSSLLYFINSYRSASPDTSMYFFFSWTSSSSALTSLACATLLGFLLSLSKVF